MRKFLMAALVGAAAAVTMSSSAQAREYAWCTDSFRMGTDCSYATFAQCRASASGTGRACMRNPRAAFGAQQRPIRGYGERFNGAGWEY